MKQTEFEIEQTLCDSIEACQYELNGLEKLLGFAWSTTEYQIPQSKIDELQKQYNEINAKYNILKNQVTDLVVLGRDPNKTSWNLDFATRTVTITEDE